MGSVVWTCAPGRIIVYITVFRKNRLLFDLKRIASLCSIQDTGCLGLVHGDDQRDDMGWEVGGGFRIGNSCTPVTDSCQ